MTPARPLVATAAGLALAGLLASCSNATPPAPEPAAPATATATGGTRHEHDAGTLKATSSRTPAATISQPPPPARDELIDVHDETGASLFAAYFLRVLNHARATGDSSTLHSISIDSCTGCKFYADVVDEYQKRGYTTPEFVLQFIGTSVDAWDPESGYARLTVTVDRPGYSTFDRSGSLISSDEADPGAEFWIEVAWRDEHWMVLEVE
ncbi:DUF6318 family protein [Kineococcus sp. LSe6-4]|uniref:DUF6318 family protein n=1 Tax=Kineococcus halophytocola TaxID=3234027 RepID=A0ABV4GYB5_9ACTN